ncbi:MAG: TfoX/Sxy family protein [Acidobacteria bacterium]|nr:TfoX/Sxy family protein [Acidobacteriota bacterium]
MAVSAGFREYVQTQLEQVTPVTLRRMFGGVGIYSQGFFFALMDNDTLFFKVDDSNRADYEGRGMGPFRPFGDDRTSIQYYELPAEILEDAELLRSWVRKSVSAAMRKSAQKRSHRRQIADAGASGKQPASTKVRAAEMKSAKRKTRHAQRVSARQAERSRSGTRTARHVSRTPGKKV